MGKATTDTLSKAIMKNTTAVQELTQAIREGGGGLADRRMRAVGKTTLKDISDPDEKTEVLRLSEKAKSMLAEKREKAKEDRMRQRACELAVAQDAAIEKRMMQFDKMRADWLDSRAQAKATCKKGTITQAAKEIHEQKKLKRQQEESVEQLPQKMHKKTRTAYQVPVMIRGLKGRCHLNGEYAETKYFDGRMAQWCENVHG